MTLPVEVTEVDNRDLTETWLHLNDEQHVRVNPMELFCNAVANLPEEEVEELGFTKEVLEQLRAMAGTIESAILIYLD